MTDKEKIKKEKAKLEKEEALINEKIESEKETCFSEMDISDQSLIVQRILYGKKQGKNVIASAERVKEIVQIVNKRHILKEGLSPLSLRAMLEDLGPTFVKIGQIMSKRPDILPKEYCLELSKLCEDSNPVEFEVIKTVIENEFQKPVEEIFLSIDEKPLGSASIGQVHKAVLLDGKSVVVKVQRPNVEQIMYQDLKILKTIAKKYKETSKKKDVIDLVGVVNEIWNVTKNELNYLIEAKNTIIFKRNLEGKEGVSCPLVYTDYCTRRVMTMEFIDGFSIGNIEKLKESEIDRTKLGDRLVTSYLEQVMEDGFFHADPHQGNIFLRDENIIWLDLGMVGILNRPEIDAMNQAMIAFLKKDNQDMINALVSLGAVKGELNYSKLYADIDFMMNKYQTIDLESINIGVVLYDVLGVMMSNDVEMPSCFTVLARGLVTIEGVLQEIAPECDVKKVAAKYFRKRMRGSLNFESKLKKDVIDAAAATEKAVELPGLAAELLKNTMKGQTTFNIDSKSAKGLAEGFNKTLSSLILALLICALLIGSAIIMTADISPKAGDMPVIGLIGFIVAVVLAIILAIRLLIKKK